MPVSTVEPSIMYCLHQHLPMHLVTIHAGRGCADLNQEGGFLHSMGFGLMMDLIQHPNPLHMVTTDMKTSYTMKFHNGMQMTIPCAPFRSKRKHEKCTNGVASCGHVGVSWCGDVHLRFSFHTLHDTTMAMHLSTICYYHLSSLLSLFTHTMSTTKTTCWMLLDGVEHCWLLLSVVLPLDPTKNPHQQ